MSRFSSSLAIPILSIVLAFLSLATTTHAVRAIPTTGPNEIYFNTTQNVIALGEFSEQDCEGSQRDELISCIRTCNSAGPLKRGNCCCSTGTSNNANVNIAFFGIAGSCRYRQQLLNYSADLIMYESKPLDSPPLYADQSCQPVSEGNGVCTCSLSWTVKWSEVQSALQSESPSPTPTPKTQDPSPIPPTFVPSISSPPTMTATATPSLSSSNFPILPSNSPAVIPSPTTLSNSLSPISSKSSSPGSTTASRETMFVNPTVTPVVSFSSSSTVPDASDPAPISPSPTSEVGDEESDDNDDEDDSSQATAEASEGGNGGSGVCVDERYLRSKGFNEGDFVHREGRLAQVWCPDYEELPCATEFHKVKLQNGNSLSYRQLCEEEIGLDLHCTRATVNVNSVWTHKWETARHGQVSLTMYDVRYPEQAQRALHRVMRSLRRMNP